MLGGCILVFLLVVVTSSIIIFGSGKTAVAVSSPSSASTAEKNYNKDAETIDESKYEGVILQKTEDAGSDYLDETLWVGDSNTVRMNLFGMVPLSNYMGKVGMSVSGLTSVQCVYFKNDVTVYTIPAAIKKVQPRRIILSIGTNDASGSVSTSSFIKSYKSAVEAIQSAYPYCDIIIAAIPPVAQDRAYPNIKQATIDEFNKAIVQMCEDMKLPFLNTIEELKDDGTGYIKDQYISEDGLHYSEAGVKALMKYARTHAYETDDRRPTVKNVPTRQEPPADVITIPEPTTLAAATTTTSTTTGKTTTVTKATVATTTTVSVTQTPTTMSTESSTETTSTETPTIASTESAADQAAVTSVTSVP